MTLTAAELDALEAEYDRQHAEVNLFLLARQRVRRRFLKHTRRSGDCLIWTGAVRGGRTPTYGTFRWGRRMIQAHRAALTLFPGIDVPEGFVVNHFRLDAGSRRARCSHLCVESKHLEVTSRGDNARRGRPARPPALRVRCETVKATRAARRRSGARPAGGGR